jgi:hypothetical protein
LPDGEAGAVWRRAATQGTAIEGGEVMTMEDLGVRRTHRELAKRAAEEA